MTRHRLTLAACLLLAFIALTPTLSAAGWTVSNGWLRNQLRQMFSVGGTPADGDTLVYDAATGRFEPGAGGGSATPAGADTQIQFNDGGAFGGDAGLTYNKSTDALTVAGSVLADADGDMTIGAAGANRPNIFAYGLSSGANVSPGVIDWQPGTGGLRVEANKMTVGSALTIGFSSGSTSSDAANAGLSSCGSGCIEVNNGSANNWRDFKVNRLRNGGNQPTCTSGCGTSPSTSGGQSGFTITMGTGTPSTPFTVTFADEWSNAPACVVTSGTAQTTRYVTAAVTSTTTVIVSTAAAPSAGDKFHFICIGNG
jgi:hypothetical protein